MSCKYFTTTALAAACKYYLGAGLLKDKTLIKCVKGSKSSLIEVDITRFLTADIFV
jgi:hypothetical protein